MEINKIAFLFFIFFCSLQQCPLPESNQSQIHSGNRVWNLDSIKLHSDDFHDVDYDYIFKKPFYTKPNLAIGLSGLNSKSTAIISINIETARIKEEKISFHLEHSKNNYWENIRINFLATNRNDIEFGNLIIEGPFKEEGFQVTYHFQKITEHHGIKAKQFIQGFSIESADKEHIGLKHYGTAISKGKVMFSFLNHNKYSIIHSISLSIVIFKLNTPGILYADGTIAQNYVSSKTQITIPRHGINQLGTYIVGISSFQSTANHPLAISSQIGEKFTLQIGPLNRQQINYLSVTYLILSVIQCGSCEGYPLLYKGLCRGFCPVGTKPKGGHCIPIECQQGYELKNRECILKCEQNEQYVDGYCVCKEGYHQSNKKCVQCAEGTTFNFKTLLCQSICKQNQTFTNGRCQCTEGYNLIGDRCVQCPLGTKYSPRQKNCLSICNENQVFTEFGCFCKPQFFKVKGKCVQCSGGTIYNQLFGSCQCPQNQKWDLASQKCVFSCGINEIYRNNECVCQQYYYPIQGVCGQCPKSSIYAQSIQQCICIDGYLYQSGKCIPQCSPNQQYDPIYQKCISKCKQFAQIWENGICRCAEGFIRNPEDNLCYPQCGPFQIRVKGQCQCIEGYHKGYYGPCVKIQCPYGYRWNNVTRQCVSICGANEQKIEGKCVCMEGYERQPFSHVCLSTCPSNEVRTPTACQCKTGNIRINGICTSCPPYTQYVDGKCVCYNGQLPYNGRCQKYSCPDKDQVWDPILGHCKCRRPLSWILGRCQYAEQCEEHAYWNGKYCQCKHGYFLKHGKCEKCGESEPTCPANSGFNGVNCVCLPGYYPIHEGRCDKCPKGTHWNGYKCEGGEYECAQGYVWNQIEKRCEHQKGCLNNEYWNGFECRCIQGTHLIKGKCEYCEYGTIFDGVECSEIQEHKCDDPYSFWNGLECVCMEGYFDIGAKCIKCPQNTYWNGVCCKIEDGYSINFVVSH